MSTLNAEQTRLIHRSTALQSFLEENEEVYAAVNSFAQQVNLLSKNNKAIAALIPKKQVDGKGTTEDKNSLKTEIANAAGTICTFAANYAWNINDTTLYNSLNFSTTNIKHLRDAEVPGFISTIVGIVTPLVTNPDFADYPVTADDLDALAKKASDFNSYLGKAARMDSKSSIASGDINATLKNIQDNITWLNRLVPYFKADNPQFVKEYHDATVVDNSGIRHNGIGGTIINSTTGEPVKGVTVTLKGKKKSRTATTDSKGAYLIDKIVAGEYSLTVTATGYEKETVEVAILRGKTVEQNMSLSTQIIEFKTA